jgi:hypothetical protein
MLRLRSIGCVEGPLPYPVISLALFAKGQSFTSIRPLQISSNEHNTLPFGNFIPYIGVRTMFPREHSKGSLPVFLPEHLFYFSDKISSVPRPSSLTIDAHAAYPPH